MTDPSGEVRLAAGSSSISGPQPRRSVAALVRRTTSVAVPLAGPVLIVACVLIVLRDFAFGGLITTGDVRAFWLPTYCFLGKSLAAGHLPQWNPYLFGGVPFAADPQSGWMYLPAMGMFATMSCAAAIRWMVLLQPLLAGLGILWFLRVEGLSRPAATTAGVVLALAVASGELGTSLPFAGTLAWTAVVLATCAKFLRAGRRSSRILWAGAAGLAWGQLAAAHFSVGLVIGTMAGTAYVAGSLRTRWSRRDVVARVSLLVAAALLVNLALLVPRLAFAPETSIGQGYRDLSRLSQQIMGLPPTEPPILNASDPLWPGKVATAMSGTYLGAAALALTFVAMWDRRRRRLVAAFGLFTLASYLLSLRAVAGLVPPPVRSWPVLDLYLHSPEWFGYGALLGLVLLAGLGAEAWLSDRSRRDRVAMLAPGAAVWLVLPAILGPGMGRLWLVWVGAGIGGVVLLASIRRPALLALLPLTLAAELVASSFGGLPTPSAFGDFPTLLRHPAPASLDPEVYLRPGPVMVAAGQTAGRFLRITPASDGVPEIERFEPLSSNEPFLHRVETAGGYSPVQLLRYWAFVRAAQDAPIRYNRAIFHGAPSAVLDLLQVGTVASRTARPPVPGASFLAKQQGWSLYGLASVPPRASVVTSWKVVGSGSRGSADDEVLVPSLSAVLSPGFDPMRTVILERPPPFGPSTPSGPGEAPVGAPAAVYEEIGHGSARVRVDAPEPSVVVIRTPWERNWHATVDGLPAELLRADYLVQGVAVPPGRHVIDLTYRDPTLGWGIVGSAGSLAALLGLFALYRRREGATQGTTGDSA